MRILVTHVTRMAFGFCCVAGITEGDHRHIRPTTGARLPTSLLVPRAPRLAPGRSHIRSLAGLRLRQPLSAAW